MKKTFIIFSVLVLSACGTSKGAKIPVGATLRGQVQEQQAGADSSLQDLFKDTNCLRLKELVDRLSTHAEKEITIYLSNYDLGQVDNSGQLSSINDHTVIARSLLSQKLLKVQEVVSGADLQSSNVLGDLITVSDQSDDCSTASFGTGGTAHAFTVTAPHQTFNKATATPVQPTNPDDNSGDNTPTPAPVADNTDPVAAGKLVLTDSTTGENRVYQDDGSTLHIHVIKPVQITGCDGKVTNQIEQRDYIVNHGNPSQTISIKSSLAMTYRNGLAALPGELSTATTSGDTVTMSFPGYEMIQSLIDAAQFASGLTCGATQTPAPPATSASPASTTPAPTSPAPQASTNPTNAV